MAAVPGWWVSIRFSFPPPPKQQRSLRARGEGLGLFPSPHVLV